MKQITMKVQAGEVRPWADRCRELSRRIVRWGALALALMGGAIESLSPAVSAPPRPNIVFILADDLGIGDVGCYGQQIIQTPNIDRLAREGVRLTNHYSGSAVCAPSRCVLMTGLHPGHGAIRDNRERKGLEGQHPIPADSITVAKLLQTAGYRTGAFGKWGLGGPDTEGEPLLQGFDRFYGYNCQRVAHNYYPPHLWSDHEQQFLNNALFSPQQKLPADADPQQEESYRGYTSAEWAPDLIAKATLQFLQAREPGEPFFCYVPSVIPHLALQAPAEFVARYRERIAEDPPYPGGRGYLPNFSPRATYAAMVSRLDEHVGQILNELDRAGLTSSTLVIFSSDNGALYDQLGGTDTDFFGSSLQFRGRKGSLYEGGIRTPLIARWPEKIPAGTVVDFVSGFEDWLPTLAEVAGIGAEQLPPQRDGVSILPALTGVSQSPRPFLYREFPSYGGQQSVRVGRWKAIRQNLNPKGANARRVIRTELYDLEADPAESQDVAAANPAVVADLEALLQQEHVRSEMFPTRFLDDEAAKGN